LSQVDHLRQRLGQEITLLQITGAGSGETYILLYK